MKVSSLHAVGFLSATPLGEASKSAQIVTPPLPLPTFQPLPEKTLQPLTGGGFRFGRVLSSGDDFSWLHSGNALADGDAGDVDFANESMWECLESDIKLMIHQDYTGSFRQYLKNAGPFLQTLLSTVHQELVRFNPQSAMDFSLTGFGDRDHPERNTCFTDIMPMGGLEWEAKLRELPRKMGNKPIFGGGGDLSEDPLSPIPYITHQAFGTPLTPPTANEDGKMESRFLIIITDAPGKYNGSTFGGARNRFGGKNELYLHGDRPPQCDAKSKYPEIDQVFQPLKDAGVIPVVLLGSAWEKTEAWWRETFVKAGLREDQAEFGIVRMESLEAPAIARGFIKSIHRMTCKVKQVKEKAEEEKNAEQQGAKIDQGFRGNHPDLIEDEYLMDTEISVEPELSNDTEILMDPKSSVEGKDSGTDGALVDIEEIEEIEDGEELGEDKGGDGGEAGMKPSGTSAAVIVAISAACLVGVLAAAYAGSRVMVLASAHRNGPALGAVEMEGGTEQADSMLGATRDARVSVDERLFASSPNQPTLPVA